MSSSGEEELLQLERHKEAYCRFGGRRQRVLNEYSVTLRENAFSLRQHLMKGQK